MPSAVTTFMVAIRKDCADIQSAVTGASDMAAFIDLHTSTFKEDGTYDVIARVDRWTDDKDVKQHRR